MMIKDAFTCQRAEAFCPGRGLRQEFADDAGMEPRQPDMNGGMQ